MPTIANQIQRIQSARNLLRTKGKLLGLSVPNGTYWDDATNTYKSYTAALLTETDQLDKIAAAFNSINPKFEDIKVPMTVRTDGTTTVTEEYILEPGYYSNIKIIPFIKVENVDDIVINVQNIEITLESNEGTISPSIGYNYIGIVNYTIKPGSISLDNAGFNDVSVNIKIAESGWVNKDDITSVKIKPSTINKFIDNVETEIESGAIITPHPTSDTILKISEGIWGSVREITIKSIGSNQQGSGDVTAEDILYGKVVYVGGEQIVGAMPNYGGKIDDIKYNTISTKQIDHYNGILTIKPNRGYYNEYSSIVTNIPYNPSRIFNTTSITADGTDTMTSQTYYETIPSGYYPSEIKRKITVQNAQINSEVDYENHKATITISQPGWINQQDIEIDINAGPAKYAINESDLQIEGHMFEITPSKDQDGNKNTYLTQVTIDNTYIFDILSAI